VDCCDELEGSAISERVTSERPVIAIGAGALSNAFASDALRIFVTAERGVRRLARILVTGAAGFIGRALSLGLAQRGHLVTGLCRRLAEPVPGLELRATGEVRRDTDWSGHFDGVDVVIHLANRAHHSPRDRAYHDEPQAASALAQAAAKAGVSRVLYMSSVKAIGENTSPGAPFRAADPPRPRDRYGLGKLATERALLGAGRKHGIEIVILRPPLVYGPGVKANLRALIRLVASGLPMPFASVENWRSMIFIDNLVDLAGRACLHPGAAGHVLLARDAVDLSTPELIRGLAEGLGRPARLIAVPPPFMATLRRFPGIGPFISRLTLSLQVDDAETRDLLGWQPRVAPETGLAETAAAFRSRG
jgi:nucleoside-diphosphate-sugar epimerase